MRAKILADCVAVAMASYPPPAFSDEAATGAWVGKLAQGLTAVAFDAIKTDAADAKRICEAMAGPVTDEEIDAAYNAVNAAPGFCTAGSVSAIGDGKILAWLKTVNWSALLQTIITIISVLPKAA